MQRNAGQAELFASYNANYAEEIMRSEEERGQKDDKGSGVQAKKAMHIHAK